MRGLLRQLRHGEELRHLPVAVSADAPAPVELGLERGAVREPLVGRHTPVSLTPFRIGLLGAHELLADASRPAHLTVRAGAALVGQMRVDFASSLRLGGHDLTVIRPSRAKNLSQPAVARWWRYALAARRAARDRRPRNLKMSAADLRCLDVYYTSPRPVYVVTVPHGDSFNLFPMDLVSFLGDAGFFLALRSSSPSIPFMQEDGRLVFSSVPAALRDTIYRLGAHHTRAYDRVDDLGLALTPSPAFGLPAPAQAFRVREFRVLDHRTVGSHVVFQAVQVAISERDLEPQLAHVSAAFASYAARLGAPFVAAG